MVGALVRLVRQCFGRRQRRLGLQLDCLVHCELVHRPQDKNELRRDSTHWHYGHLGAIRRVPCPALRDLRGQCVGTILFVCVIALIADWLSSMPAALDLASYNRFILAFWMAQPGAVDNAQAWEQFDADYRQQVLDEYHAAGIALMVSAFGSTGGCQCFLTVEAHVRLADI